MLLLFILNCLIPVLTGQTCFNGGVYGGSQFNKCYHFFYSPVTYENAEGVCHSIGSQLVSITNAFEQNFIFGHARQKFVLEDYWIGLTDLVELGNWRWDDGTPFGYKNWIPGNLSSSDFDNCVAARLNNGHWYNTDCDTTKKHFVCQAQPENISPAENATYCPLSSEKEEDRGKCLFFIASPQTYSEAELTCGSLQGVLTSVVDANEMSFITAHARANFAKQDYWLGLNDFFGYHQWQWSDDTNMAYLNWAAGFPSNVSNKSCVGVRVSRGTWYNEECEGNTKYFVCESETYKVPKPTLPPPTTTTLMPSTCPSCPAMPTCPAVPTCPMVPTQSDWTYFYITKAWYKVISCGALITWEQAEAQCQTVGGHLASIHSYRENEFVYGLNRGLCTNLLVGLKSYVGDLATFRWSDRSDMDYNHWAGGKPSIENDNRFCGYMDQNQWWYNLQCNTAYSTDWGAVCKKM